MPSRTHPSEAPTGNACCPKIKVGDEVLYRPTGDSFRVTQLDRVQGPGYLEYFASGPDTRGSKSYTPGDVNCKALHVFSKHEGTGG